MTSSTPHPHPIHIQRRGPSGFGSSSTAAQVAADWDGKGKVVIITGASAGLGLEATRVLVKQGAHVRMLTFMSDMHNPYAIDTYPAPYPTHDLIVIIKLSHHPNISSPNLNHPIIPSPPIISSLPPQVVAAVRDMEKATQRANAIRKEVADAKLTLLKLDLMSMQSVKSFVEEFRALGLPLHVLMLNAV